MAMPLAGCPTATDCDGVAEMRVTYEKQAAYTARARGAQAHTRVITMYEKEREKEDRAVSKGESAGAEKERKKEREAKKKENGFSSYIDIQARQLEKARMHTCRVPVHRLCNQFLWQICKRSSPSFAVGSRGQLASPDL